MIRTIAVASSPALWAMSIVIAFPDCVAWRRGEP
jgi:hypothetical protein